jgi:hypothetical protein
MKDFRIFGLWPFFEPGAFSIRREYFYYIA